jgi:recombination protein RecA
MAKTQIKDLIKALNIERKDGTLATLGSDPLYSDIPGRVSTGSTQLDLLTGGGIPRGRLTEILGAESLGKSTLCEHILAHAQADGLVAALIDFESTFDKKRAMKIGIRPDELMVLQPITMEDGFEAIDDLVRKVKKDHAPETPILLVWDTIAAAPARTEKAGKKFGEGIANKPRLLHEALRRLTLEMAANDVTLVLANQVIDQIGSRFGPRTESPGGRAIKHHSSLRIKITKSTPFEIKEENNGVEMPVGIRVKATLTKSKVPGSVPRGTVEIPIYNYTGIDDLTGIIEFLVEHNSPVLSKKGGWYKFGDESDAIKFRFAQRRAIFKEPALREVLRREAERIWRSVMDKIVDQEFVEEDEDEAEPVRS